MAPNGTTNGHVPNGTSAGAPLDILALGMNSGTSMVSFHSAKHI